MASPGSATWMNQYYGPGWPNCSAANKVTIKFLGHDLQFHKDAAPLFKELNDAFWRLAPAYAKRAASRPDTGSFVCRPIGGTSTASNHSFGTAVDVIWQENGMDGDGTYTDASIWTDQNARKVVFWAEANGFRWGGRYGEPDPMHFEIIWTPAQIREHLNKKEWDEMATKAEIREVVAEVVKAQTADLERKVNKLQNELVETRRVLIHGDGDKVADGKKYNLKAISEKLR